MALFYNAEGNLKKLNFVPIDKEKNLQRLIEENLFEVLELYFIASEYPTTHGGRIDTIALGADGAPVIIEYKRNRNDNVINQALSYLKWLKAQKKEFFEMLVTKKLGSERANNIDWKNPRVICIAESYSKFDIDTLEVIPLRLELHKFRYYENNVFSLEQINNEDQTKAVGWVSEKHIEYSVNDISDNLIIIESDKSSSDISLYSHLNKGLPFVQELFLKLKSQIYELDENIQEKITAGYISYRLSKSFIEIHIQKSKIVLYLRPIEYLSIDLMVEKIPDTHKWTLDRRVYLDNESNLESVMKLIEQSYRDVL